MLSRPGPLPSGSGWSYEVKWDGFRAVISTEQSLRIRSRRGWDMTPALPELTGMPSGLVLDGELVAWCGREPYFPLVGRRILNGDFSIRLTYMIFDLLGIDGTSLVERRYEERRSLLEQLDLQGPYWNVTETFDDGEALYSGVCEMGLEGVVAKRTTSRYGAGVRGWVKVKNPNYWRRDSEMRAMQRTFGDERGSQSAVGSRGRDLQHRGLASSTGRSTRCGTRTRACRSRRACRSSSSPGSWERRRG
jgi:ATP-dependent DNA ligase